MPIYGLGGVVQGLETAQDRTLKRSGEARAAETQDWRREKQESWRGEEAQKEQLREAFRDATAASIDPATGEVDPKKLYETMVPIAGQLGIDVSPMIEATQAIERHRQALRKGETDIGYTQAQTGRVRTQTRKAGLESEAARQEWALGTTQRAIQALQRGMGGEAVRIINEVIPEGQKITDARLNSDGSISFVTETGETGQWAADFVNRVMGGKDDSDQYIKMGEAIYDPARDMVLAPGITGEFQWGPASRQSGLVPPPVIRGEVTSSPLPGGPPPPQGGKDTPPPISFREATSGGPSGGAPSPETAIASPSASAPASPRARRAAALAPTPIPSAQVEDMDIQTLEQIKRSASFRSVAAAVEAPERFTTPAGRGGPRKDRLVEEPEAYRKELIAYLKKYGALEDLQNMQAPTDVATDGGILGSGLPSAGRMAR